MENLDKALKDVGENVVSEIKRLAIKRDGFKASGSLEKSISYKVKGNIVEISALEYIGAISDGIHKKKFPNVHNILEWAKSRGLQPRGAKGRLLSRTDANMKSMAFVIARSIAGQSPDKAKTGGISKRFGYQGSGFLEEIKKDVVNNVKDMIAEAYKLDIIVKLKEI
tara:strand:- start:104 stop:604 length:501 start_codon:yes stop_codon:yes gene_type:complete